MNDIKVSVIIPIYNEEECIRQCLDSVVTQSLKDIEIICVDDGSTDRTPDILEEYAKKDCRLTVIHQKNSHAGIARNNGLSVAKGQYIHFLDADDYVSAFAYEKLYKIASVNELDFVKFCAKIEDAKADAKTKRYYSLDILDEEDFDCVTSFDQKPYKSARLNVAPWCALYSRTFLIDNKIVFPDFLCAQDREFNIKTIVYAKKIMYLKNAYVFHRNEQGGGSVKTRSKNFNNLVDSYKNIGAFLNHINIPFWQKLLIKYSELRDLMYWFYRCKCKQ